MFVRKLGFLVRVGDNIMSKSNVQGSWRGRTVAEATPAARAMMAKEKCMLNMVGELASACVRKDRWDVKTDRAEAAGKRRML